jgi:hypothetical protein
MKMKKLHVLCIALLTAGVAMAGVFDPDYRGDDNSVHAIFVNPLATTGLPFTLDLVEFETGPSTYPLAPVTAEGFYDGFATGITLPNFIDELPMKKMRIQMDFLIPVSGIDLFVDVYGVDPLPVDLFIVGGSDPSSFDISHYIDIEMYPNPDWEEIFIANLADPINAPYIVEIDTISIPEPATLGLLGLISGGIFFTRRIFTV